MKKKNAWILLVALAVTVGVVVPVQAQNLISIAANGSVLEFGDSHSSYPGTIAMDGDIDTSTGNRWLPKKAGPAFVTWEFSNGKYSISKYRMQISGGRIPSAWTVYGSNDNINWTTLDSQSGLSLSANTFYEYTLGTATDYYAYYKLLLTATSAGDYYELREFELYGEVFVPSAPVVELTSAANETATTADLQGTLTSEGVEVDVIAYWSTSNNTDSVAWLGDGTKGSEAVGTYNNVTDQSLSVTATNLTSETTYYYTLRATNDTYDVWSSSNATFDTTAQLPPVVGLAGGGTNVAVGSATLQGVVSELNGILSDVIICFGTSDGGTNEVSNWDTNFVFTVGDIVAGETFSTNVTDLLYGLEYNYRVYATNEFGDAWSANDTFTTEVPVAWTPAELTNTVLALWLDAADSDTITQSGGKVSQWDDKSGNENHATKAVSDDQPSYLASDPMVNNLPSIGNLSASGSIGLDTPSILAKTVYVVTYYKDGTADSFDGYSTLFSGPGTYGATRVMGNQSSSALIGSSNFNTAGTYTNGATASSATVLPMPVSILKLKSNSTITQQYSLGYNTDNDSRDWQGFYSEWLFTDGSEDSDTEALIEGYLAHKWGLAGSLPAVHPYKSTDPRSLITVEATSATNVTAETADLRGTLNATQSVFTVTAYWSTNDNQTTAAWTQDVAAVSQEVGTYTNLMDVALNVPVSGLTPGTNYYYTFQASNAATNLWSLPAATFETESAPEIFALSPTNNAVDELTTIEPTVTFDRAITLLDGSGVSLTNLTAGADVPVTVAVSASTNLVITPDAVLADGATFAVLIADGAIAAFAGITDTNTWQFTTVEATGTAPEVSSLSPTDGATGVSVDTDLSITFDQPVLKGSGNIEVWQSGGGSAEQTIDVQSGSVTVDDATATIVLSPLSDSADYYVLVSAGAFTDVSTTLDFAGLTANTDWTFQTEVLSAPTVTAAGGATGIDAGVATLNGVVTDDGNVALNQVVIYMGTSDGEQTPANWDTNYVFDVGDITEGVTFSTNVTGLLYGERYYYRVFATNAQGGAWSTPENFLTTASGAAAMASGGSVTNIYSDADGAWAAHIFYEDGNFVVPAGVDVEYLIVGGGGGGGGGLGSAGGGGGGGAGGVLEGSTNLAVGTYAIEVGAGGAGGTSGNATGNTYAGNKGDDSSAFSLTAEGGGFGGRWDSGGGDGGSGGGAGARGSLTGGASGLGTSGQGFDGGSRVGTSKGASSGGGAGGAGIDGGSNNTGRNGGAALTRSITGASVAYAGGGAGGGDTGGTSATGGDGGAGSGNGSAGADNTGGGGGGGGPTGGNGAAGGSGIVVVRYRLPIEVEAVAATDVGVTAGTLQGLLRGAQAVFDVTAYWSTNVNASTQDWQDDNTKTPVVLGSFTNALGDALEVPLTSLQSGTTYYYVFSATNLATNLWSETLSFTTKTEATVTLNAGDLAQTYDGTARSVAATTDPAALSLIVTYDGSTDAPTQAGSYEVIATIDELLYVGAVTGTLEVAQADPGVTSWPTATAIGLGQTLSDATLLDGAATQPGDFAFADPAFVPPAGTNDYWVLYTPTDDVNYETVSNGVEVIVSDTSAEIFLSDLSQPYDGTARPVTVTTDPAGLNVVVTYDGGATVPTNVGSYAVEVIINDGSYVGSTNGTLVISKGTPVVTLLPMASSIAVGQSVGSSGLSGGTVVVGPTPVTGTFSFNDPSFTPPETGTYQVNVNFVPDDTDNLVSPIVAGQVTITVQALLYNESFAYGDAATSIHDVFNWSASSANLKYDPAGLTHPVMNDEQGGSMWLDDTTASSATDSRPNVDLGALEVGDVLWYAVLIEHYHGSESEVLFNSDSNVGDIYIRLLSDGQVQLNLSKSGSVSGSTGANRNTGIHVVDGETSLLLLKVTKGSPKDSPTNTGFAFWLNPSKALQESDLRAPDWSASDGLFGRDPGIWGSVVATPSLGGRIDEIRVGTSLTEVLPFIFEPSIFRFR